MEFPGGLHFLDSQELRMSLTQTPSAVKARLSANTAAARERYRRLLERMNSPHRVLARDKAAFVLGTLGSMCAFSHVQMPIAYSTHGSHVFAFPASL
jgi:hypothetical protein